jgi:hypothetical protein
MSSTSAFVSGFPLSFSGMRGHISVSSHSCRLAHRTRFGVAGQGTPIPFEMFGLQELYPV